MIRHASIGQILASLDGGGQTTTAADGEGHDTACQHVSSDLEYRSISSELTESHQIDLGSECTSNLSENIILTPPSSDAITDSSASHIHFFDLSQFAVIPQQTNMSTDELVSYMSPEDEVQPTQWGQGLHPAEEQQSGSSEIHPIDDYSTVTGAGEWAPDDFAVPEANDTSTIRHDLHAGPWSAYQLAQPAVYSNCEPTPTTSYGRWIVGTPNPPYPTRLDRPAGSTSQISFEPLDDSSAQYVPDSLSHQAVSSPPGSGRFPSAPTPDTKQCEVCGKVLKSSSMSKHKLVHKDKQFPCSQCKSRFTTQKDLTRHEKAVHLKERNYTCSVCGRRFNRPENLRRHDKTHDNIADQEEDDLS